ncbi:AC4 [Telfairia golden mosaic virus]|uniref:AC4 n=2 Tax=Viruses TaxID=10239 RepID=A0A191Z3Z7_9GEMI|nr:AC4 [Telfairia golden mosaic virus]ALO02626.1 AC4 [Telfairia golden mosaic virus]ANJ60522.1 AC4 [Telfairia mosaic virus]ANJ60528.1 AC4 [Telfairia mosaic virus]
MGSLISTCLSSSRGNSRAPTIVSSIVYTQAVAPVSTPTFRALSPVPTSSRIWTRTEIHSNGESFRSTGDRHEGANNQLTTHMQRHLTQEVNRRLLM